MVRVGRRRRLGRRGGERRLPREEVCRIHVREVGHEVLLLKVLAAWALPRYGAGRDGVDIDLVSAEAITSDCVIPQVLGRNNTHLAQILPITITS